MWSVFRIDKYCPLTECVFRCNKDYDLIPVDSLSASHKLSIKRLVSGSDVFGILRPRRPDLKIRTVSHDAAPLFAALGQPNHVPVPILELLGDKACTVLSKLVLDGLLDVQINGRFVTSTQAYSAICEGEPLFPESPNAKLNLISRLSLDALKYASALELPDNNKDLWLRLYFYNRLPASSFWTKRFPLSNVLLDHLLGGSLGVTRRCLESRWISVPPAPNNDRWAIWKNRELSAIDVGQDHRHTYKLYVSPQCAHFSEALRITIDILTNLHCPLFKFGIDVYGLLRPDKLVIYLPTLERIGETAQELTRALKGMPPHGVPFTAEIGGNGLISWAMDPPRAAGSKVLTHSSWRVWITQRLAQTLTTAKRDLSLNLEPWRFTLARVALDGVDPISWTPGAALLDEMG